MYQYIYAFLAVVTSMLSTTTEAKISTLNDFGSNPGELTASYYQGAQENKNLVVLLHGCVQQGELLAEQSGLLTLASAEQFSVLIPQQNQNNNIKSCFNWFSKQDIDKNQGESLSIKNMIDKLNSLNKFDDIYIVGLSAGGAMASTMLVNYPDTFTAGAIVAGIPSPCADNLIKAISCMRSGPSQTSEQLTQQVKKLNTRQKTWPAISIWTGKQDKVVNPINSTLLAQHWVELTSSIKEPTTKQYSGYKISQWRDEKQQQNVELIEVENMTHGIAVTDNLPDGGTVAPFLIKAPISTMKYLVKKWQLDSKA